MAESEQIANSSEASDTPLTTTATTTVQAESDSTTMEALSPNNLGKFVLDIFFALQFSLQKCRMYNLPVAPSLQKRQIRLSPSPL